MKESRFGGGCDSLAVRQCVRGTGRLVGRLNGDLGLSRHSHTEIIEEFARFPEAQVEWAPYDRVAQDVPIGAAYAGKRSFSSMNHVGVNVALDS